MVKGKKGKKPASVIFPETREGKVFKLISDGYFWLLYNESIAPSRLAEDLIYFIDGD